LLYYSKRAKCNGAGSKHVRRVLVNKKGHSYVQKKKPCVRGLAPKFPPCHSGSQVNWGNGGPKKTTNKFAMKKRGTERERLTTEGKKRARKNLTKVGGPMGRTEKGGKKPNQSGQNRGGQMEKRVSSLKTWGECSRPAKKNIYGKPLRGKKGNAALRIHAPQKRHTKN